MRFVFLLAAALAFAAPAFADSIAIDPQSPKFGSVTRLVLTVDLKPGEKAVFGDKVTLPKELSLLSVNAGAPRKDDKGNFSQRLIVSFIPYATGPSTTGEMEYIVKKPDGSAETRTAGPVDFTVASLDPKEEDVERIVAGLKPVDRPVQWETYIVPLLVTLAVAVAIFFIWRWLKRRKKRPVVEIKPKGIILEPDDAAWRALIALSQEDLFGKGAAKEHFFRVSAIIREYVERRFGVKALERTTFEIEREFPPEIAAQDAHARLLEILSLCDIVKFTKTESTRQQADDAVGLALQFISVTRRGLEIAE
ncbi:MAG: hypothetical protein HZB29_10400 [Nitrospinae bacterium]|nr:hypothetical protein [Nitrospinota bacterium]